MFPLGRFPDGREFQAKSGTRKDTDVRRCLKSDAESPHRRVGTYPGAFDGVLGPGVFCGVGHPSALGGKCERPASWGPSIRIGARQSAIWAV